MIDRKTGRIIFISSLAGQVSYSIQYGDLCHSHGAPLHGVYYCIAFSPGLQMAVYGYSAYSASKYAVRGLAEVLDMELKVHNIRVGVSFPPDTDTPMLQVESVHSGIFLLIFNTLSLLTQLEHAYSLYFCCPFLTLLATSSLQEEVEARSPIQAAQAKYGSVFEADKIARDICCGIERGSFLISHGFDGLLLKIITAGMSPVYHWCTAITEVCVNMGSPFN